MRKHRDIKFVTTEERRKHLVSEPNYHITKKFSEDVLAIEMKKKTQMFGNKPVYLGQSILEISKIVMYEFWYMKPRYWEKAKLCCMNIDSFIVYIKTEDLYADIAEYLEKRLWYFILWIIQTITYRKKI